MNYSDQTNSVRVDFFKPSGKWYATEAVVMDHVWNSDGTRHPAEALLVAIRKLGRYSGLKAVCLQPYHEFEYPIMVDVP